MRRFVLAGVALAFVLAGCDRSVPEPKVSEPRSTSGAAAPSTDREPLPPSPSAAGGATKPDPGDANDHSNPRHDARKRGG